jgi:uncharacterized protein YjbJ (UPF0337 family)
MPPPNRREEFAKTAAAAKLSGSYNKAAGYFKQSVGTFTNDAAMENAGRNQQVLGRAQALVGSLRGIREAMLQKIELARLEYLGICSKHGSKALDVAAEFVEDLRKTLLK